MRLRTSLVLLTLTACTPASPGKAPIPTETHECVSIATWNDLHGQLGPDEAQVGGTRVPAGGVIALADRVAALRALGEPVVLLDAGDLFTGPLESSLAEGAPVIEAYNILGVDAAAIGNHEFDFGPEGYARVVAAPNVGDEAGANGPRGALFARMRAAHFPFLSANLERTDRTPLRFPNQQRSAHIKRGGFDIGVVGYTTNETPTTTLKPNVAGLDFSTNTTANLRAEIRALRAGGASPVVLLAHASLEGLLPQQLEGDGDSEGAAREGELARVMDSLAPGDRPDVIVAGHRHQWMLGRLRGVPIVSSDCHGVGLSRLRFCRTAAKSPVVLERIERHVAMASNPPASPLARAVAEAVAPWQAKVKAEAEAIVTTLPRACADKSLHGTLLGEQTARAIAEHAGAAAAPPPGVAVVAFMNSGGLRAPLRKGPLHYRDLFATSPFENGVAVCETTRAGLERALTNAVSAPEVRERFPFGLSGAHVTLTRKTDGGLALKSVVLDGESQRGADDTPVWFAMPDFILWGGDAILEGVTCRRTATSSLRVRDALKTVIAREGACDGPPKNIAFEAAP